jgi:small nuclear ribonucleoprotein (snRNP)-like protein
MDKPAKGMVAAGLIVLLIGLPGALTAKQRRGADVVINLKAGTNIVGELVAVRPNSLVVLTSAGKDESVQIGEIITIIVVKKRSSGQGVLVGMLMGALFTGVIAYAALPKGMDEYPGVGAMLLALPGAGVGALLGAAASSGGGPEKIAIAGRPVEAVRRAWAKLAGMARVRGIA